MPAVPTAVLGIAGAVVLLPLGGDDPAAGLGQIALTSESEAMAQAMATGKEVVADALTTSKLLVTALPSGNFRAQVSLAPVRVKDDDGDWQLVDNTLVEREDGSVGPLRPAVPMSFSGGGSGPLAEIANADRSMSLSWPHGDLPEPELTGTVAKYSEVVPGVDLVAKAGIAGWSTYVIVHSAEAAKHPAIQALAFDIDTQGVEVTESSDGGMAVVDGAETVFSSAAPIAWDSEGVTPAAESAFTAEEKAVDAPLSPPVKAEPVQMTVDASSDSVAVSARSLLNDPNTVWPAILDPSWADNGYVKWTMVWSNGTTMYNSTTEHARVGYDGWSGSPKKSRAYYAMDVPLSTLQGTMITKATFSHWLRACQMVCVRSDVGA